MQVFDTVVQSMQLAPAVPQAVLVVPERQLAPELHPVQQAPFRHLPLVPAHAVPSVLLPTLQDPVEQSAVLHSLAVTQPLQASPLLPQYWLVGPGWHAAPSQQKVQQLPDLHLPTPPEQEVPSVFAGVRQLPELQALV